MSLFLSDNGTHTSIVPIDVAAANANSDSSGEQSGLFSIFVFIFSNKHNLVSILNKHE